MTEPGHEDRGPEENGAVSSEQEPVADAPAEPEAKDADDASVADDDVNDVDDASHSVPPGPRRSAARATPRYSASRRIKLPELGMGSGAYKIAGPGSGVYALSGAQQRLSSGKYSVLRKRRESAVRDAPRLEEAVEDSGEPDFELDFLNKDKVERTLRFRGEVATVGREANADICIDNLLVSRLHAEIRRHQDLFALVDLKSPNGSFVNGKQVKDLIILNDGDVIVIGKARMRFRARSATVMKVPEIPSKPGVGTQLGEMTLQMSNKTRDRLLVEDRRPRGYVVSGGGRRFVEEVFQIGAGADCDLKVGGLFAPRKAALIVRGATEYRLINVGAAQKVTVNGGPVADLKVLKHGDRLVVRGVAMRFEIGEAQE